MSENRRGGFFDSHCIAPYGRDFRGAETNYRSFRRRRWSSQAIFWLVGRCKAPSLINQSVDWYWKN